MPRARPCCSGRALRSAEANRDEALLRRAIALSRRARDEGNHPFGALLVDAAGVELSAAMNAQFISALEHAETRAVRFALTGAGAGGLARATLYASAEPCAMCAGAIYWAGVGRVVYGLSERRLLALTGANPANPTLSLPCREVFARGQRPVEVLGPLLEDEAAAPHRGFWS